MSQSVLSDQRKRLAYACVKAGRYSQANLYLIAYALSPSIKCGICSNSANVCASQNVEVTQ